MFCSCKQVSNNKYLVYNQVDSLEIASLLSVADTCYDLEKANQCNIKAGDYIFKKLNAGNRSKGLLKHHCLQLNNHGLFGTYKIHKEEELPYYYKALGIAEQINDAEMIAVVSSNLAHYYGERKEHALAVFYYTSAVNNFTKANKLSDIAHLYNIMGAALMAQSKSEEALACYQKGIAMLEGKNNAENELLAILLSNIGSLYEGQKNQTLALSYYTNASSIHKKMGNITALIPCLQRKGIVFLEQKELDSAKLYLTNAVQLSDSINSNELKERTLNALINYYKVIGDIKQTNLLMVKKEGLPTILSPETISNVSNTDTVFYHKLKKTYIDSLLNARRK